MNFRTFLSDKQALIDEGKRIVSMSDDAKFLRKVTIVNLMLNGASASSLSPFCGETTRTLISWMKAVDEKGFDALRPKKQPDDRTDVYVRETCAEKQGKGGKMILPKTFGPTRYYQFADGRFFKYDPGSMEFFLLLRDGTWQANHSLMREFYDTWSDYEEIGEDVVLKEIAERQNPESGETGAGDTGQGEAELGVTGLGKTEAERIPDRETPSREKPTRKPSSQKPDKKSAGKQTSEG